MSRPAAVPVRAAAPLCLVLPVRDEAAAIGPLLLAARDRLAGLLGRIVLVDDASTDGTAAAAACAWGDPGAHPLPLEIIELAERAGRGASFRIGAERASAPFVAYLDADLQFDPGDLRRALALARSGADVVCGERIADPGVPRRRRILSAGFRLAARALAGLPCADPLCGFKLFRRAILPGLLERCRDPHWFFDFEAMARAREAGFAVADLPLVFDRAAPHRASKTLPLPLTFEYLRKLAALARARRAGAEARR